MSNSSSNRELIDRARKEDRDAFDQLFEEHRDRVEYFVRLRLGEQLRQQVAVDDVLQEVALRAYRSVGRFHWRGDGSFLRWLRGIAEHVILETASRQRRRPISPLADDVAHDDSSQATTLRRDERFERLQETFDRLSSDHRKVILLARLEKLPLSVVAEKMERSPAAVKQLLYRALQELRSSFGETESLRLPDRRLMDRGGADGE